MGPSLRVEDFWNRATRLGDTTGRKDWATRLGEKTGRHDWATRLGEKTGRHLRGPGGGSNGRRKNDRNSQSHFFRFLSPSLYTISMHARSPPHFFLGFLSSEYFAGGVVGNFKIAWLAQVELSRKPFFGVPDNSMDEILGKNDEVLADGLVGNAKISDSFFHRVTKIPLVFFLPLRLPGKCRGIRVSRGQSFSLKL